LLSSRAQPTAYQLCVHPVNDLTDEIAHARRLRCFWGRFG